MSRRDAAKPLRGEQSSFATREDGTAKIEVHVAAVCVRKERGRWKVLAGKRTPKRSLFPNKWECGGGQVRPGENFKTAIQRQIFEEFGLTVDPLEVLETYEIHIGKSGQRVIPGVRFLCVARGGRPRLNGREFSRYRWLDIPLRVQLDWISGIRDVLDEVSARLTATASEAPPARKSAMGFHPARTAQSA
jgi:8-oxo-dGTP pyrophosphatase MutT (NUDIX family)